MMPDHDEENILRKSVSELICSLVIVLVLFPGGVLAGVPTSGEFTATKACQAYQSMRKRTNPDNTILTINQGYPVVEANVDIGTTWYRITVDGANPPERWVYFECGIADATKQHSGSSVHIDQASTGSCNVAGKEDSYVFAVSWQPAFCEGHPDKPECKVKDPDSYQAKNFTLHGLWPNKNSCGTKYGFCGKYKKGVRPFCNYDKVPMSAETLDDLGKVMPSASYGSCLQRHEWYKHGTCQIEWNADGYYENAMQLLADFNGDNIDGVSAFMVENLGKQVSISDLSERIDQQFGADAHKRMQYTCTSDNKLVDVYISLPAKLGDNIPLTSLIQQAPEKYRNKCGDSFVVDRIDD